MSLCRPTLWGHLILAYHPSGRLSVETILAWAALLSSSFIAGGSYFLRSKGSFFRHKHIKDLIIHYKWLDILYTLFPLFLVFLLEIFCINILQNRINYDDSNKLEFEGVDEGWSWLGLFPMIYQRKMARPFGLWSEF